MEKQEIINAVTSILEVELHNKMMELLDNPASIIAEIESLELGHSRDEITEIVNPLDVNSLMVKVEYFEQDDYGYEDEDDEEY